MTQRVSLRIGDEDLVLETGHMAKQANGAVFARVGGSAVIATACCAEQPRAEDLDFVPLSVDYIEKYYAAGKIPGGFIKREGRPKDKEILVSRFIDRPLRPLFSKTFKREIQVVPIVIATDLVNQPDIIAMNAASAAVTISDIPFAGPVGAVRVAYLDGEFVINPSFDQVKASQLDLVIAGTDEGIMMVEGGARQVSEAIVIEAITRGHGTIRELCRIQNELRELAGKPKIALPPAPAPLGCEADVRRAVAAKLEQACFVKGKQVRSAAIKALREETRTAFTATLQEADQKPFNRLFDEMEQEILRRSILEQKLRTDGRGPEDIRPIECQVDLLPRTHGSALFTRGETQALVVTTLGTALDEQILDNIDGDARKGFMLNYNFPPFSVGETGRLGAPGRREIGHGHLAERALEKVLPPKESFPYTIRLVSEILESNGSSSMATVCGGTLSLLNAGVPMAKSVAGIAMGLVKEGERFVVLSDILGEEDHLGDMDFKVAGTDAGITALQMDIKIKGVTPAIMTQALDQARRGRLAILSVMNATIREPRSEVSSLAPKVITLKIPVDKIGLIIGPGGKNIKAISEKANSKINIDDDGTVTIYCPNKEGAEIAQGIIAGMVEEPEVGRIYQGTVKRIMDFGAFVEILPGKEGLVHVSMLSADHVESPYDVVKEGQALEVKLTDIDRMGRLNLATPAALEAKPEGRPPRPERGGRPRSHEGSERPYGREGSERPRRREGSDRPPRSHDRGDRRSSGREGPERPSGRESPERPPRRG
jgi:polyribonucleotide nucleotidyltransferase